MRIPVPNTIPGTTKLHCLEENIWAVSLALTTEDLGAINAAVSQLFFEGARYPEQLEKLVGR